MISKELSGLLDLTKAQILHIYKPTKIIIVDKDKNFMFATFQIVAPDFNSFDNGLKLIIIGFIPCFSQNYLS